MRRFCAYLSSHWMGITAWLVCRLDDTPLDSAAVWLYEGAVRFDHTHFPEEWEEA